MAGCDVTEAACVCVKEDHPTDEPHVCECGGSWSLTDETFTIWSPPGVADGFEMDPLSATITYPHVTSRADYDATPELDLTMTALLGFPVPKRFGVARGAISFIPPPALG